MKIQQNISSKINKPHTPNKSLFKYNCPPNSKIQSPNKQKKTQSHYTQFVQGFIAQSFNNLKPISQILTEKQLSKWSLFQAVKKMKGQFYFKTIYQKSKYMEVLPSSDLSNWFTQRKYFVYIISGQFNIYKRIDKTSLPTNEQQKISKQLTKENVKQINLNKCYIRSYGPHEHFGYQQYPLYWNEKLIVEATMDSKIILFSLDTFYKIFSNVINLAAIQLTAEFLKKISVFKEVQMQKLLRISTFSQRIRTYPNTLITQKGQTIQNLILLFDGRVSSSDKDKFYTEDINGFLIGKRQIDSKKLTFDHQIKALIQCDLIVIPLIQFAKVSQIKHKLRQSILEDTQKNIKSRKKMYSNLSSYEKEKKYSITGYKTLEQQIFPKNISTDSLKPNKSSHFINIDDLNESQGNTTQIKSVNGVKYRPKTASQSLSMGKGFSRSVFYDDNGRQFYLNRVKTSMNDRRPQHKFFQSTQIDTKVSIQNQKQSPIKSQTQKLQNVTMSEIYWSKFMNRKVQLQNKQITKIINARLPECILNENKQYAIMKPLIQKKSTYIKNYKRKIKHAQKINDISEFNDNSHIENTFVNKRLDLKVHSQQFTQQKKVCLSSFMIDDQDF